VLLMISGSAHSSTPKLTRWIKLIVGLFLLVVFANLVSTLLECGLSECPSDPTKYLGLEKIRSWISGVKP